MILFGILLFLVGFYITCAADRADKRYGGVEGFALAIVGIPMALFGQGMIFYALSGG